MAYIICEPCVGTKDTACVDACPVDCIHPKKDEAEFEAATMLYIHPEECIDCGACEPACPVTAIFPEDKHFCRQSVTEIQAHAATERAPSPVRSLTQIVNAAPHPEC